MAQSDTPQRTSSDRLEKFTEILSDCVPTEKINAETLAELITDIVIHHTGTCTRYIERDKTLYIECNTTENETPVEIIQTLSLQEINAIKRVIYPKDNGTTLDTSQHSNSIIIQFKR